MRETWTQNTRIIHELSNEEKTNDYENFEKGMIYMKILKKGGGSREKGEEETKSTLWYIYISVGCNQKTASLYTYQSTYAIRKRHIIAVLHISKPWK